MTKNDTTEYTDKPSKISVFARIKTEVESDYGEEMVAELTHSGDYAIFTNSFRIIVSDDEIIVNFNVNCTVDEAFDTMSILANCAQGYMVYRDVTYYMSDGGAFFGKEAYEKRDARFLDALDADKFYNCILCRTPASPC